MTIFFLASTTKPKGPKRPVEQQPLHSGPCRPSSQGPSGWKASQPHGPPPQGGHPSQPSLPLYAQGAHPWNDPQWNPSTQPSPPFGCTALPRLEDWDMGAAMSVDCSARDASLSTLISSKLDSVITSIDGDRFSGDERELVVSQTPRLNIRGGGSHGLTREVPRGADRAISTVLTSTNYFSKVNLYVNSRLPRNLPPLTLYIPTYPLLSLAARYSQRVYAKPSGLERHNHVDPDWRIGTKAMVIKSIPIDHMNVVVFAIRGSQTFMDWAVNLNSAPAAPTNFLDDPGNLCHSGFLSVARKMVKPVAARLRTLLEEDPARASSSLLITGHSAGGAVASLLYAHMLSRTFETELNILTECFKRVHCITFGAPPISLLPLQKPSEMRLQKSIFLSFINEGDPVPRADKAYVRSLINLYSSPAPRSSEAPPVIAEGRPNQVIGPWKVTVTKPVNGQTTATVVPRAVWRVPPCTLSNAGRLVLLRTIPNHHHHNNNVTHRGDDDDNAIQACLTSDQQLRGVVFGDPVMHMMKIYARRIEILATNAVLAKGGY